MIFNDRKDAGEQLAQAIRLTDADNTIVLALPRGGIPLGIEIAKEHHLPLDILLSKKIGHPFHSEYAVGAVSEDGKPLLNKVVTDRLEPEWLTEEISQLRKKMAWRRKEYSKILMKQSIKDKRVILVDDGVATGLTIKAGIEAVKKQEAKEIIVAVPVIPKDTYRDLLNRVDQVIALEIPEVFLGAVGAYYRYFPQVEDDEIKSMLTDFDRA